MEKFLLSLLLASSFSSSSFANSCLDKILDEGNRISDIESVRLTLDRMVDIGVEPRVILLDNVSSYGTLESYERSWIRRCPEMQDADGTRKNNAVIIAVSFDPKNRQGALFLGGDYKPFLNNKYKQIRKDYLFHNLKNGDIDKALIETANKIYTEIDLYENPPPPKVLTPEEIARFEAIKEQKRIVKEKRIAVLLEVTKYLIIASMIIGFLIIFRRSYIKGKKRRERIENILENIFDKIKSIKDTLEMDQLSNDSIEKSLNLVKLLRETLNSSDLDKVDISIFDEILGIINFSKSEMLAIKEIVENFNGSEEEAVMISERIDEVESGLDIASSKVLVQKNYIDDIHDKISTAIDRQERLRLELSSISKKIDSASDLGYSCREAKSLRIKWGVAFKNAEESIEDHMYISFHEYCDEAERLGRMALNAADGEKVYLERLIKEKDKIYESINKVEELGKEAKTSFGRISSNYNKSSWKEFSGHGSSGDKYISSAKKRISEAEVFFELGKNHSNEKADEEISQSKIILGEAAELFQDVIELEKAIKKAEVSTPSEINLATQDIIKSQRYISENSSDVNVNNLSSKLSLATSILNKSINETKKDKPDWIKALNLAIEANSKADNVFSIALSQKEEKDRKRRLAKTTISQAESSIEIARRYIRSHSSDVGSGARNHLEKASSQLNYIKNDSGLDEIISIAKKADSLARDAKSYAVRDYNRAEEAREAAAEAIRLAAIAVAQSYDDNDNNDDDYSFDFGGGNDDFGGSAGW